MTIYLLSEHHVHNKQTYKQAFTCKQTLNDYQASLSLSYIFSIEEIELITDQFMEQILQPKESHETNTNSSL